jgi:integrase/recombinase XerD
MKTLAQLVEEYLRHLSIERGLAKNTVAAYRRDLTGYLAFLEKSKISEPSEINETTVNTYLQSIAESDAVPVPIDAWCGPRLAT